MTNVLDLLRPSTKTIDVYGAQAVAESLRFLDWFAYDALLTECLVSLLLLRVSESIGLIGKANEMAAGLPASVSVNEGLAAFRVLAELNEIRYMDPALKAPRPAKEERERELGDEALMEMISTLATRYTMSEICEMTPEFALLSWQKIREEIAMTRNAIFYSTELGYRRRSIGKDKYKLVPRKSPYTPFWVKQREEMERPPPIVPKLVSHPERVIDGLSGKSLAELGEVSV